MSRKLWENVHNGLSPPGPESVLVKGNVVYYHYGCDGTDDRGWGCGYRTLQTLCAWAISQQGCEKVVPSLRNIQEALVAMGDKPTSFVDSKEWIGSYESSICMDYFLEVPCKIVHVTSGTTLFDHVTDLKKHFDEIGSPVMMGGDSDNASKGVLGVCPDPPSLLILDPHYYGEINSPADLYANNMVTWRALDTFHSESFYNLCLPQFKYRKQSTATS